MSNTALLATLEKFTIPDRLQFEVDEHGLIRALVSTPLCEVVIYLQGAHLTHWQPRGCQPVLFLSRCSEFAAGHPIRGGIPIIFPWFGPKGGDQSAPPHGWARRTQWNVASTRVIGDGDEEIELVFRLDSSEVSEAEGACSLEYRVRIGQQLHLELQVTNTSTVPLAYEEALHTYFEVDAIDRVTVEGLAGVPYVDKCAGFQHKVEGEAPIVITSETDRIYSPTQSAITICDEALNRRITVAKDNSASTVVWNPWSGKAAAMPDFGDDEWQHMLCIETANVANERITLEPHQTHTLSTTISVESS